MAECETDEITDEEIICEDMSFEKTDIINHNGSIFLFSP